MAVKMNRLAVLLVALAGLYGCATGERVRNLSPGMPQQEVVSVLGKPDGFQQRNEYTLYQYTNRLISGWSWDRADYTFVFKGGKLVEYGPGEVREKDVGGVQTIFLHQY